MPTADLSAGQGAEQHADLIVSTRTNLLPPLGNDHSGCTARKIDGHFIITLSSPAANGPLVNYNNCKLP